MISNPYVAKISSKGQITIPISVRNRLFPEMRDIKDSPILATAIMEGIDMFITDDKDFLVEFHN